MTLRELKVHRELQYLRAAARAHPRRPVGAGELARRRRYVEARYRKLRWVEQRLEARAWN